MTQHRSKLDDDKKSKFDNDDKTKLFVLSGHTLANFVHHLGPVHTIAKLKKKKIVKQIHLKKVKILPLQCCSIPGIQHPQGLCHNGNALPRKYKKYISTKNLEFSGSEGLHLAISSPSVAVFHPQIQSGISEDDNHHPSGYRDSLSLVQKGADLSILFQRVCMSTLIRRQRAHLEGLPFHKTETQIKNQRID